MTEQECLERMVAPGTRRPGKYREGVIQVWVTRACDQSCFGCTQGSNLGGKPEFITVEQFEQAVISLRGYFGVVGTFGGNPAMHPKFDELCLVLQRHVPFEQRGLWCNNPRGWGKWMRETFNPAVSNLNVHLDRAAFEEFKRDWPECNPVGLDRDSRHSPPFVAMKDVVKKPCENCNGNCWVDHCDDGFCGDQIPCPKCNGTGSIMDESRIWELISGCDINQHWSAMIGVFRGGLRAWFCEVAGAQAMLHQDEPDYPDTGLDPNMIYVGTPPRLGAAWWELPMQAFRDQVRMHCFDCGVPLRGYGELAMSAEGCEQTSATHAEVYQPKRRGRPVQCVTRVEQLGVGRIQTMTRYLQNASK